jgi:hypothetical protein
MEIKSLFKHLLLFMAFLTMESSGCAFAKDPSGIILFHGGNYLPPDLPEGTTEKTLPKKGWTGILSQTCELFSTDINIVPVDMKRPEDEINVVTNVDGYSGWLLHGLNLPSGPFVCSRGVSVGAQSVAFMGKDPEGNIWRTRVFKFGEQRVVVIPRSANEHVEVVLKVDKNEQILKRFRSGQGLRDVGISTLGDIDRDGLPDVIVDYSPDGPVDESVLYLSGRASKGELVGEAAKFSMYRM